MAWKVMRDVEIILKHTSTLSQCMNIAKPETHVTNHVASASFELSHIYYIYIHIHIYIYTHMYMYMNRLYLSQQGKT